MHTNTVAPVEATPRIHEQIESFLRTSLDGLLRQEAPPEPGGVGRPQEVPSLSLWLAVLVCVLRGLRSQRAIWRVLVSCGVWGLPCYDIVDQTVYKRLEQEGQTPLQQLFERISLLLATWLRPLEDECAQTHGRLAPFASDVVALDETTLDPVARTLPILRLVKKGAREVLPGKLVSLFDVRLQQWRAIEYVADAQQNCKKHARQMLTYLSVGTLILADLGYFSFAWFDELTQAGFHWVARQREKTSYEVIHVYYQLGETFDGLVWLGVHEAKAGYGVRLVEFRVAGILVRYLTNVTDPHCLSMRDIARLYARRWDIELAFKTLKRELGLHLLWSSKPVVLLIQVWAALIIAQVLQALRMEVAFRAQVDPFEVSLPLFIDYLPLLGGGGRDGLQQCVIQGRSLGLIRPSSRIRVQAPEVAPEHLRPLPTHLQLPLRRTPVYPEDQVTTPASVPPPRPTEPTTGTGPTAQQLAPVLSVPIIPREPVAYTLRLRRGVLVRTPLGAERRVS